MLKKMLKKVFPGISWQNPMVRLGLAILDPLDYLFRATRGLRHLPKYSIRVISNGVNQQFGGASFARYGDLLARILQQNTGFGREADILEIGCGCGRTALGLRSLLADGKYTGMDINRKSLEASQNNPALKAKNFKFDLLDVYNFEYNPTGKHEAQTYTLPYENGQYEVVFLVSVFTHMLQKDVSRYIQEISRILKPGGYCMLTSFLVDYGKVFKDAEISFRFTDGVSHFRTDTIPEMAVGYYLEFFENEFGKRGMKLSAKLPGSWRNTPDIESTSGFPQDILFFRKKS